jgi:hypothetical protein
MDWKYRNMLINFTYINNCRIKPAQSTMAKPSVANFHSEQEHFATGTALSPGTLCSEDAAAPRSNIRSICLFIHSSKR